MIDSRFLTFAVVVSVGFLAALNVVSAEPKCNTFSAGACVPDADKVITSLSGIDEKTCQSFCNETLGCEFYQWERKRDGIDDINNCVLHKEDYRQNCAVYGADMDTDLATCIQKVGITDTCDEFIHQDCNYDLEEISLEAEPGTIADASHCQELCGIFIDSLGCRYWVFEDENHTADKSTHCTLYKTSGSVIDSCNTVHGPKSPFHDECGPELN